MTEFGRDTYCDDTLRTGRMASGLTLLGQRCKHRLITPRGMLRGGPEEGAWGMDLPGMVGGASSPELENWTKARIRAELEDEDQVESVYVELESETTRGETSWTIHVWVQSALGPFELVGLVDAVGSTVLDVMFPGEVD